MCYLAPVTTAVCTAIANTSGIRLRNAAMIHHNNLSATAFKNTSSATRVNFQVYLVPLSESILRSSIGLQTGSGYALQEKL